MSCIDFRNMKNILRFLVPTFIFVLQFYTKIVISSSHDSHYIMHKCENRNNTYITGSTFQSTLNDTLLSILPEKASRASFANSTNGTGIDQVNALFYCRGDDTLACLNCVQAAAHKVTQRCQFMKEAVIWFEECTLRYANRSIFFIDEESPMHIYTNKSGIINDHILDPFKNEFDISMDKLIKQAASSRNLQGFVTTQLNLSSTEVLQCAVQCSPDISEAYCERCLKSALNQRDKWADTMILMPSCFIRVDLYNSTAFSTSIIATDSKGLSTSMIVIISVGCSVFFVVAILAALLCYIRYWPDLPGNSPGNTTLRKFTYIQLVVATNGFSRLNYLGQGSFGRVYSGVFRGQKLAVKRLKIVKYGSQESRPLQSLEEFMSEIETNFQAVHDNIVKVVGYCNEGKRKLLVYELIENNSLKKHLHGTTKRPGNLAWENRKKIALGCAKGLRYLHDECETKIVHRDIKPSNILLDSNYEPKLGDFGLAKAFYDDASYVRTITRGTPGYLDPEYVQSKRLTEKSDVYSFGVVLLELITGEKPKRFQTPESISLSLVHDLHTDAIGDPVDEKLYGIEDRDRLNCMIICAALCTHPSSEGRLSMGQVVELLEEGSVRENDVAHIMVYARMSPPPADRNNLMGWSELNQLAIKVLQIQPVFPSYGSPVVQERQGTAYYSAITSNGSEIHQVQQIQDATDATTSNASEIHQDMENTEQGQGSAEATTSSASEIFQVIANTHQNQGSTDITTSEASEICQVTENTQQRQGSSDATSNVS